eukprot:TRINITY_DN4215_c0_g1_i1.p1 TRINITY_DN4215_c0_g1~~TRINITY_DN4215_c0_g1_i1.p1  ORF type:complete len:342 (-),score=60.99 TRINITY_DN4215_c0_g1_i1:275-1300(-)
MLESPLKDKTVLLVAPSFFGYSAEIERQLKAWGATVHHYENRPSTSVFGKAMVRLFPKLWAPVTNAYYAKMFEKHRSESIDYLFVIRGEGLTDGAMRRFSSMFPSATKVLYLWDSFRNDKGAAERIAYFDIASSFDVEDARSDKRLRFLPLFYLSQFSDLRSHAQSTDLCFVGTVHTDRYAVLKRLAQVVGGGYRIRYFLFFPSRLLYRVRRLLSPQFWGSDHAEFSFDSLGRQQVLSMFGDARAVVDIERPIQTGLTIRSLETLGAQRKLVTTNATVREYDFYDERNIAVIDRTHPTLPANFLDTPFHSTPESILSKYSVERWLRIALALDPLPEYGPKI